MRDLEEKLAALRRECDMLKEAAPSKGPGLDVASALAISRAARSVGVAEQRVRIADKKASDALDAAAAADAATRRWPRIASRRRAAPGSCAGCACKRPGGPARRATARTTTSVGRTRRRETAIGPGVPVQAARANRAAVPAKPRPGRDMSCTKPVEKAPKRTSGSIAQAVTSECAFITQRCSVRAALVRAPRGLDQ